MDSTVGPALGMVDSTVAEDPPPPADGKKKGRISTLSMRRMRSMTVQTTVANDNDDGNIDIGLKRMSLEDDDESESQLAMFVISPNSTGARICRWFLDLSAASVVVTLPFALAFEKEEPVWLTSARGVAFAVEFLLGFLMVRNVDAHRKPAVTIPETAKDYIRSGWAFLDALVLIGACAPKTRPFPLSALSLLALAGLWSRTSLDEYFRVLRTGKRIATFRLIRLLVGFFLSIHLLACGWRSVRDQRDASRGSEEFDDNLGADDDSDLTAYLTALQETMHIVLSGSGLSSVSPRNNRERFYQV